MNVEDVDQLEVAHCPRPPGGCVADTRECSMQCGRARRTIGLASNAHTTYPRVCTLTLVLL